MARYKKTEKFEKKCLRKIARSVNTEKTEEIRNV